MAAAYSQLGGLLDGLIDWLSDAFNNVIVQPIFNFFSYIVGAIFYGLQMGLFYIMDAIQLVFRRVAGLDVYYDNGVAVEGDMVEKFFTDPTVQAVFFSILIAAIILLFITTFIAVLKTEFDEKDNAKGPVFKSAIKAIAYFAIVPIVCIMGIAVSNIVLRMLDSATSQDARSFSTQVFVAAAWDCNRARGDADFARNVWENQKWIPGMPAVYDQEAVAMAIDQAFRGAYSPTTGSATVEGNKGWGYTQTFTVFSITSYDLVFYYYNPLSYNYLIGYVAGFAVCMMMLNLLIGVIQRIFELCVLFVLSPVAVALMPLDGGGRYGAWRTMFVKRVFSAYGPILGMNLVFMVLTLMQDVQIFPDGGMNGLYNAIVQILFIFTGLVSIRSLVDLVTELVGQGDALKQGESTGKQVKDFGAKAIGVGANIALGPAKFGANMGRRLANRIIENKVLDKMAFDSSGNVRNRDEANTRAYDRKKATSLLTNARGAMASAGNRMTGGRAFKDSEAMAKRNEYKQHRKAARDYLEKGGTITEATGKVNGKTTYTSVAGKHHELSSSSMKNVWAATGFGKKIEEGAAKFGPGMPVLEGFERRKKKKEEKKAEEEAYKAYKQSMENQAKYAKEMGLDKPGDGDKSKETPKNNLDTTKKPGGGGDKGSGGAGGSPSPSETPITDTSDSTTTTTDSSRTATPITGSGVPTSAEFAANTDTPVPVRIVNDSDTDESAVNVRGEVDTSRGTEVPDDYVIDDGEIHIDEASEDVREEQSTVGRQRAEIEQADTNADGEVKVDNKDVMSRMRDVKAMFATVGDRIIRKLENIEHQTKETAMQSTKNVEELSNLNKKTQENNELLIKQNRKGNSGDSGTGGGNATTGG